VTPSTIPQPPARVGAPKTTGEVAVDAVRSKLGSRCSSGGTGPDAFDCSGLVQWSYGHSGRYAGDGTIIHASTYGGGVELAPVSSMPVAGARRF
jgi:cell wall-associated NlpC family hydrolase